jgi:polysaccharide pyruvyl transferase WcaK-like protein
MAAAAEGLEARGGEVRHGQKGNVRRLLKRLEEVGLEPVVAAQQEKDNFTRNAIPLVRKAYPTVYEYDARPYLQLVEESVGAIGWRLHGNMIHLAHGNPAILLANCSRGESFCEAFDLPVIRCPDHHKLSEREIAGHVEQLLDPATFAKFPARYAEHRAAMAEFLEANGLDHNLFAEVRAPEALPSVAVH